MTMLSPAEAHDPVLDVVSRLREGKVDGALYRDPVVFDAEMERIFHRWWVYVGHMSEIAEPGDYVLKWIGRIPVIMTRDEQGEVHVLLNRCRHRASTVCEVPRGNSMVLRCQYHGWTYKNSGRLVGVSRVDGYGEGFDKSQLGLLRAPRVGVIKGFVFASLASDGIPFEEYIAPAAPFIHNFCNASPVGRINLGAGVQRTVFKANWKFIGGDGYHGAFTHASTKKLLADRNAGTEQASGTTEAASMPGTFLDRAQSHAVSLGQGHGRLHDDREKHASITTLVRDAHIEDADRDAYEAAMHAAYGETFRRTIADSDPHIEIWPNLQLTGQHVRTIRPIAADETHVDMAPALLEGVPDGINEARVRSHEWFFGPASFGSPDDTEIFERIQAGLQVDTDPTVLLARGLHRETTSDEGWRLGNRSDETTQRGALNQWTYVMGLEGARRG